MSSVVTEGRARNRRNRAVSWLLLAIVTGAGFALLRLMAPEPAAVAPPDPRPLVDVAGYQRSEAALELRRLGRIHPRHETGLAAEVGGRVESVDPELRPGGRVTDGQVLVDLDTRPLEIRRRELVAELKAHRAERDQLALRLGRLEALAERDFVAGDQLEEMAARVTAAEAAVERVAARIDAAELDLERSRVVSPYAASVLEASVAPGDVVQPGRMLARLASADAREVRVSLPMSELPLLEAAWQDGRLRARLPDAPDARLEPARLADDIDDDSRTVMLSFTVIDARLRRGELVQVILEFDPGFAHYRIPRNALRHQSGRVWRLAEGDTLEPVTVTPVLYTDDQVHVRSDELGESGAVLVTRLSTVTPGMAVRVRTGADAHR